LRLEGEGLVERGDHKEAILTAKGTAIAERVVRRHRIIERLLTDFMGYTAAEAHEGADMLGNTFTDDMVERCRKAGVHPSTASRALNESTRAMVNAETVTRVHQAADRLGYLPDALARGLKMKRTFTVGMLIPDLTNPLFPPIARGIEDVLGAVGYTLVLASTDNDPAKERAVAEVMLNRRVDGLILATARREYPLVEELARHARQQERRTNNPEERRRQSGVHPPRRA
jgi:Mn-dependent DtxR family transcriptional regulator